LPLKSKCPQACRDDSIEEKTNCLVRGLSQLGAGGDGCRRHLSPGKFKSTKPSSDKKVTFKYPANPCPANEAQGGDGLLPGIKSSGLK